MESQLSQYYAVAKERFPTARAISIMSGIQTVDGVPPLEWWTVLVYSTPIAPGATVIAQCSGDTFEEALELAAAKIASVEAPDDNH